MNIDYVKVSLSSCGIAAGADKVYACWEDMLRRYSLKVELKKTGCLGFCYAEPLIEVKGKGLGPVFYGKVMPQDVEEIVGRHLLKGEIVERLLYRLRFDNLFHNDEVWLDKVIFVKDTSGSIKAKEKLAGILKESGYDDWQVIEPADMGIYDKGIVVDIPQKDIVYVCLDDNDLEEIPSLLVSPSPERRFPVFSPHQKRIVLRHCGVINPESIDDYLNAGGYKALEKALSMNREDIIKELAEAGLRGRGGGGFITARKWEIASQTEANQRYIVCNADEGDPGAYMDRSILEGDPHSVIEGMLVAGLAVGADKGFFYIRAEYPLAIERVRKAIEEAYRCGYLGKNIRGSGFSFDIEVRLGAGAFVCGEETALIASLEGGRGLPRPRPPYPSIKGLWGKPTVINNVETLANVAAIIDRGGRWFASFGTSDSRGTKVFALTGKVRNSGLIEVEMGISLEEIIFDIGGGTLSGRRVKAVQTGGPSGGVIPAEKLKIKVDYQSLKDFGSIIGSGGMIVMDEDDCMVDIAKFYLGFCIDESCGKCAPCRIGGWQLYHILEKITQGRGREEDIDKMIRIAYAMQKASLCGLGQTAPNPVISTLKYFREEYQEHILNKRCPSLRCNDLVTYVIKEEKCRRCGVCQKTCPAEAIAGDKERGFYIEADKCVKCGRCIEVCKFKAIERR